MTDKPTKTDDATSLNLWQKLAAITGDIGSIAKDGQNRDQKYSFIEYAAVAGQLRGLFAKYRVVCIPHMKKREAADFKSRSGANGIAVTIDFEFVFKNADKPEETETIEWIGEAADYGDKATNKAATAALKYCLMRTFNISEKGDDPDGTTIDRGDHPVEPRQLSPQMTRSKIFSELTKKGFDADQCKQIVYGIADADMDSTLSAEQLQEVLKKVELSDANALRDFLLEEIQETA
jgi:hypothetical protein